jgi:hypothetical protein
MMVEDVPRLINMGFEHMRAQVDALDARVSTLKVKLDNVRSEVQALPRVLAEMLDERAKRDRS